MLEDNSCDPTNTRGVLDKIPSKHSHDLLAQHHLKRRTGMDNLAEIMHHDGYWDISAACSPTPLHEQPTDRHLRAREGGVDQ